MLVAFCICCALAAALLLCGGEGGSGAAAWPAPTSGSAAACAAVLAALVALCGPQRLERLHAGLPPVAALAAALCAGLAAEAWARRAAARRPQRGGAGGEAVLHRGPSVPSASWILIFFLSACAIGCAWPSLAHLSPGWAAAVAARPQPPPSVFLLPLSAFTTILIINVLSIYAVRRAGAVVDARGRGGTHGRGSVAPARGQATAPRASLRPHPTPPAPHPQHAGTARGAAATATAYVSAINALTCAQGCLRVAIVAV